MYVAVELCIVYIIMIIYAFIAPHNSNNNNFCHYNITHTYKSSRIHTRITTTDCRRYIHCQHRQQ